MTPSSPRSGGPTTSPRRSLRSTNTAALVEALRAAGPSSQASLARSTGLSPATVNSIVRSLAEEGLVEVRPVNGRQSEVSLVSTEGVVLSLEVTDVDILGAAFSLSDRVRIDRAAGASDPAALRSLVAELREAAPQGRRVLGVAVAFHAPIDRRTGMIADWVGERLPRWRGIDLAGVVEEARARADGGSAGAGEGAAPAGQVVVDNDANLAALAEWTWGAGHGAPDYFYIKASEGVGGGLVVDGRVFHGGNGMAGVLGHMVVDPNGAVCYCGSRGCLTTKVSEAALVSSLSAWHKDRLTLRDVVSGGEAGDPACTLVLAEAGRQLGRAAANAARLMAPSRITVGGLLGASGVVAEAVASSPEVANLAIVAPETRIVPAVLGEDASVLGGLAAVLGRLGTGLSELPEWARPTAD